MKEINIKISFLLTLFFAISFCLCFVSREVSAQELMPDGRINKHAEKVVETVVHKKGSVYTVDSMLVTTMGVSYSSTLDAYKGKGDNGVVMSFSGKALGYFVAGGTTITVCFDEFKEDGSISGGCEEVDEGYATLYIPYFPNGKYADIYNAEGKKVFTVDLSSKATCNENNNCNRPLEDSINCPSDCRENQPVVDKIPVQTDNIASQNFPKEQLGWWESWGKLALAILIVIVVGVGAFVARQKSRARF